MATLYIHHRPFASRQDGGALVVLELRSDPLEPLSGLDWYLQRERERVEGEPADERPLVEDEAYEHQVGAAMAWASTTLLAALGLGGWQADIEAWEGAICVAAEVLPEALRQEGVHRLTLGLGEAVEA